MIAGDVLPLGCYLSAVEILKLVHRRCSGPARIGGGPGTGKTIVALHRVCHLVRALPPGRNKPVLLTTFNRNLAADLRARLLSLGGPDVLARVDIAHVDQLATRIVSEADPGSAKRRIDDTAALREWRELLVEAGETHWSAEFLSDEWNQVILGQAVTSRSDYSKARRAGRGRSITRSDRAGIWQLAERFTQRLETKGLETHRQVAERAARLEIARKARIDRRSQEREERGGLDNLHGDHAGRTAARPGVHIGTMYRFKGLEYRCLIIAGAAEGLVPRASVDAWEHPDPSRHRRELHRARSLLFVAATRARDGLAITWHGEPSRFLAPLLAPR